MKIKITSDCFRLGGVVVAAGEVIECEHDEAIDLISSGRAVRDFTSDAAPEPEKATKAKK